RRRRASKYPHHNSQPNHKGQLIIRDAEYQKHLALTFIDTLLSSQRTRTHHHYRSHNFGRSGATFPAYLIGLTGANRHPLKTFRG
ncbi:hypothetical protein, partial [Rhodococcus opacus]|uniref:hypothetical protein n=1 Tax=Rhodococcus opacus TaxID=37919 RepID=UPI001ED9597E